MDKILMNNQRIRSQVDMAKTKSRVSMEKMKDCVWIYDFDMKRFLYINASSSQLGGLTADEAMKKKAEAFFTSESLEKIESACYYRYLQYMDGNRSDNIVYDLSEYEQYNQDGSIKHIEMSTRLDFNENTHSVVMIGVSRNVTTQKIHQQELIETIKSQLILIKEFQVVDNDKPELQVYFFGKFRVLNSHVKKPIKWRTTKTEELFAFLIENDKPYVSKDKILESLWPDLGIEKAAKYLHTNTYNLKKDLKSAGISFQLELINGFYCYDVQNIHSDLAELRSMIKTVGVDYENFDDEEVDKIEQVILLYESDYLAENDYLWATSQSALYRKQYEKYVFTLARYYFFKRNYPSTERVLCKLIEIDNFNENYHELLLQAYLFDQDYISFVDHYKELKALFLIELDQTPSPSIQGLYKKYQDSVEVSRNNKNVKTDL